MKNIQYQLIGDQAHGYTSCQAEMSLALNDLLQKLFKPPHQLSSRTRNSPIMESFVLKPTNSHRPKLHLD